ncbi:murein L,D-transpeptidase catalytic domain family protein [Chitinophaga agrisoli]|nr:murein L,D-transpeptidase catalytic domain family protein [Chitinophaga agrisoli]
MVRSNTAMLYDSLQLGTLGLSTDAFMYGIQGFQRLLNAGRLQNDSVLAIVDFSLPSSQKRLFVIDVRNSKLLFNTLVSHGRNSGKLNAVKFSNKLNSNMSSLGFYITDNTYIGEHGLSLRLQGAEKSINDNAMRRGIVMHGASYVDESFVDNQGYIGRSLGCPAIPEEVKEDVITALKNGACLFIYSANPNYIAHSKMLQRGKNVAMNTPVMPTFHANAAVRPVQALDISAFSAQLPDVSTLKEQAPGINSPTAM